jgi:predicted nuclease of restriction endonuclease-like (RecB) superfamily
VIVCGSSRVRMLITRREFFVNCVLCEWQLKILHFVALKLGFFDPEHHSQRSKCGD